MSKILLNFTPHTVNFLRADSALGCPIDSSGVARAAEHVEPQSSIMWDVFGDEGFHHRVPTVRKSFGAVTGLPDPAPDTLYIVSQIVFDALPGRNDLIVPSDVVRGPDGQVIGCRSFSVRSTTTGKLEEYCIRELTRIAHQAIGSAQASDRWPARVPLATLGELESASAVAEILRQQAYLVEIVEAPSPYDPGSPATRHLAISRR